MYNIGEFREVYMKKEYKELFRVLVNAYESGTFRETVKDMINESPDKDKLMALISTLSGIDSIDDDNFTDKLEENIKNHKSSTVVNKINSCSEGCYEKGKKRSCAASCPFNAIFYDTNEKSMKIVREACTDCGLCIDACPENTILDKVEFLPLLNKLRSDGKVIAAVAPAIAGQFGNNATLGKLRTSLKKLGFFDMVEVAFFADMLTLKEAVEFNHLVNKKEDLMITSCCCPMWVGMVKKVYKDLIKYVSPSLSPMAACGRVLKEINPSCHVVFIGPCVAKKAEAKDKDVKDYIDFVLTFQELKEIFQVYNINPETESEESSPEYASRGGRLYGRLGGVSTAISDAVERLYPEKFPLLSAFSCNGVKECRETLDKAVRGELNYNFIEGMGCIGGCVGGPKANITKESGKAFVDKAADKSLIKVAVDSDCMIDILKKININSIEDFKNEEKTKIFHRDF